MHQYILTLIFCFSFFNTVAQSKIKDIEKQVNTSDGIPNSLEKSSSDHNNNELGVLADLVGYLLFSFPDEENLEEIYGAPISISKYTYASEDGRYTRNNAIKGKFNADIQLSYFIENSNLQGLQSMMKFQFIPQFSVDLHYSILREKTTENEFDYLHFLHTNISYHRLAFTRFDFWIGTGYTQLNISEVYHGWNVNIGTEIFIKKPVSIYSNWYVGGIEELNFIEGDALLKVYLSRFSLFAGYQQYSLGSTKISGPKGGLSITI